MEAQTKLLLELLEENRDTEYGQKYGFADIRTIEDFQKKVPVTEYDDYAEYIDRMVNSGEENLICSLNPVWYNKTSGTVGAPKKIPYTQRTSDCFMRYSLRYQSGLMYKILGDDFFGGRSLNLLRAGNSIVRLENGIPYGPISEASIRPFLPKWDELFPTPSQAAFAPTGTDFFFALTDSFDEIKALCPK